MITVNFQTDEYNVSESEGTVTIQLMANETSEFDYNVTLRLVDYSTGLCVHKSMQWIN